jgi:hypothetical protein
MGGRYLLPPYPPSFLPPVKVSEGGIIPRMKCMGKKNFIGKLLEKGKINFWKKLGK